ncbi:MAG TPA: LacI family DNA-binding transcriptional regulator [Clostridia bacterium]|nr:LacI family DNA-binding transcriptional regulator [Clostridia bacterium]
MAVTIKDVANEAGVSIATVSHVINKTRYVGDELTDRVNNAIKKLGYYPNQLVGSLRNKKTYTVGLVLPSISNETFGLFTEIIQKMLFKFGYNLIICNTSHDIVLEEEAFNTMLMKKVDAIIAIPVSSNSQKLREIQDKGVPIVLVDRVIEDFEVDTVRVDNFKGTYEIVKYLINIGHSSIGYIDRKVAQSHSIDQRMGYKKALEDNGIPYDELKVISSSGYDYEAGIDSVKALLNRANNITAVCAYYDITAFGAMRGILDIGYHIPDDISVVGYDGMPFTAVSYPRLTTVITPVDKLAHEACNLVIKRLETKYNQDRIKIKIEKKEDIVIVPELIIRESTSSPLRHT